MTESLSLATIEQIVSVEYSRLAEFRQEKGDRPYIRALGEKVVDVFVLLTDTQVDAPLHQFGEAHLKRLIAVIRDLDFKGPLVSAMKGLCLSLNQGVLYEGLDQAPAHPEIADSMTKLGDAMVDRLQTAGPYPVLALYEPLESLLGVDSWELRTFVQGIFKSLHDHNMLEIYPNER